MAGYWEMPGKTAEAMRGGWLHSGDLARWDADGYLAIAGRAKDVIISGGENIYPAETERVLKEIAGVRDAAVVGVPDREWGESVLAVIVPEEGAALSPEDVIAFVRARLAGFKRPRFVRFVDALPVTATGKVQKGVLRERFGKEYGTV
jgi:fatty-acyl-CoA synthase